MISWIILITTVIVSIVAFGNRELFYKLSFSPPNVVHSKEYYRIISHAFVHGGWLHLLVNMYVLYGFATVVENTFINLFGIKGELYFVLLYFGGAMFATLPSLKKHQNNYSYNSVGASGAIAAVLFSYILFYPTTKLMLIFLPIPISAWIMGVLYLVYEYYMDKNSQDVIAHDAHFWGAIFGVAFSIVIQPTVLISFFSQIFE